MRIRADLVASWSLSNANTLNTMQLTTNLAMKRKHTSRVEKDAVAWLAGGNFEHPAIGS